MLACVLGALLATSCMEFIECRLSGRTDQYAEECERDYRANKARYRLARDHYKVDVKACAGSDPAACFRAAGFEEKEGQWERAAQSHGFACSASVGPACGRLGVIYRDGKANPPPGIGAQPLLEKACQLGDATGCADAAGGAPDAASRATLNARACTLGQVAAACFQAAEFDDQEKRLERAAQGYQIACDGFVGRACRRLGVLYRDGKLQPPPGVAAQTLFEKACKFHDADGCIDAAWGAPDAETRATLNKRACAAGRSASCQPLPR